MTIDTPVSDLIKAVIRFFGLQNTFQIPAAV